MSKALIPGQKQGRRAYYFLLFALIDRQARGYERPVVSKSDFDDNEAFAVLHNQIEFTESALEVSLHGT